MSTGLGRIVSRATLGPGSPSSSVGGESPPPAMMMPLPGAGSSTPPATGGRAAAVLERLQSMSLVDAAAALQTSAGSSVPQARLLTLPTVKQMRGSTGKTSPELPKAAFFSSLVDAPKLTAKQQLQLQKLLPTSRFTNQERTFIGRVFLKESEDHDLGSILSLEGLKRAFRSFNMNDSLLLALFNAFDKDGNHGVDLREFSQALGVFLKGTFDEKLRYMFGLWDVDHSGSIDRQELKQMLVTLADEGERTDADAVFERLDLDRSGLIDFDEFARGVARMPLLNRMFHRCFAEIPMTMLTEDDA